MILIKHQNSQNQIPEETARELQMNTESCSCSELSGRLPKDKPKHFTYRIFQKVHWHLIRVPTETSNLEFQENLKITSFNSHFTEEPYEIHAFVQFIQLLRKNQNENPRLWLSWDTLTLTLSSRYFLAWCWQTNNFFRDRRASLHQEKWCKLAAWHMQSGKRSNSMTAPTPQTKRFLHCHWEQNDDSSPGEFGQ